MDASGFSDFDGLMQLVRRTHDLFDLLVRRGSIDAGAADYLTDATLPHLEAARAAFRTWLRAEMADVPELQYLIRQGGAIGSPPSSEPERVAAQAQAEVDERTGRATHGSLQLDAQERQAFTALSHARIVMGLLPRLPDQEVRLPVGRRTYADIPIPKGPAELAGRIEELERQVWQLAVARHAETLDPAFRRTYGFFDVAELMARRGFRLH